MVKACVLEELHADVGAGRPGRQLLDRDGLVEADLVADPEREHSVRKRLFEPPTAQEDNVRAHHVLRRLEKNLETALGLDASLIEHDLCIRRQAELPMEQVGGLRSGVRWEIAQDNRGSDPVPLLGEVGTGLGRTDDPVGPADEEALQQACPKAELHIGAISCDLVCIVHEGRASQPARGPCH